MTKDEANLRFCCIAQVILNMANGQFRIDDVPTLSLDLVRGFPS